MNLQPKPNGFVLIMVLVVIMLASMVAASLLFVMSAEHTASAASEGGAQAWTAAMSGVYQAIRVAADPETDPATLGDNPAFFRDQLVSDDGAQKWYFSVYSLPDAPGGVVRFGLADEASRLNPYNCAATMLETLPNLSPQLAQALLAALPGAGANMPTNPVVDTNSVLSVLSGSTTNAANPRWTCLDELLDVSGITPALLYGAYSNLTSRGLLQTNLTDALALTDSLNGTNLAGPGLGQFLTLTSYDLNQDNDGKPRVNLNQTGADLSGAGLPALTLAYLDALHTNNLQLTNVVDLLFATNSFPDTNGKSVALSSGITLDELPGLLDHCTTTNAPRLSGLINLNTASAPVLAALPGLNQTAAESIVAARVGLAAEARKTTTWLVQEGLVNPDTFKGIAPYLTTRGYQYHFFAAAYSIPPADYRVIEAVVDVASQPPAVILLRDVSRLGLPFDPSALADPAGQTTAPTTASPVANGAL